MLHTHMPCKLLFTQAGQLGLLSPALTSHGAHTSLAFLLSGESQCWSKVYHTGIWIAIQLWLSPFSLLEQTFASASFHLLPT